MLLFNIRYVMLLQELLKYTDEDHGDYNNLQSALVKVKELADKINQLCNEAENTTKILSAQRRISGKVGVTLFPFHRSQSVMQQIAKSLSNSLFWLHQEFTLEKAHWEL